MVKQVRAARTRQSLIRAAAEVFAADGYALASLPAISRRAGVSAGALHFHFASKDALATEVESAAADSVEKLAERCRDAAGTSLQSLMSVMSGLLLAVADDPVVRAGFKLSGDPSRKGRAAMLGWWHDCVRDLVLQAQRAGELADGVSPDDATTTIVAATVGMELVSAADDDWLSADRMAQFWSFIMPRLAAVPERVLVSVSDETRTQGSLQ
ncbi:ScbR family autoregulator-binding transcription factor [Streptomyces sp. NBC_00557]|jgi:AcrR family transcriptional regulator|uniref:ScbR family autoregulator-binding transcription factor n=1 Tax=Streptomyces sp. NBC_00557 TaxID=2975776 RepID=UPI002E800142|nr:ScbR family autoregulator-binding transcription factor [Streptomyces sp. NBC_00557]WUC40162.1 TetR/AcrR family transcriptional regulator [Streptomyces sp. NBC_00557]